MGALNLKIVAVVAAVILLLGGGALLYTRSHNSPSSNKQANSSPSASSTPAAGSQMSAAELFASGQNKTCTFDYATTNGHTQGVFYVSGTNVRGDINTVTSTKTDGIHIIRQGDINYMWGSSLPSGIKMKISADAYAKSGQSAQTPGFDPNKKTNFTCVPWTVDASLFTPPTDVKFTDMTSMTAPSSAPAGGSPADAQKTYLCTSCNALTGDDKTSCLTIYHCN